MNLKELNSFKLSDAVTFHDTLNPKLWAGNKLRPEVKKQLEVIVQDFLEEMGINDLDVKDMTISGSNAAYSYTGHSDLDLHILVNMNDLPNSEIYKEFFNAKKSLYNDSHDITIHGVPVELYVENAAEPAVTLGEYSIMHDKWLRIPTKRRANFDQTATRLKFEKLLDIVERALQTEDLVKVQKVLKKIKQYRQAGLDKGGEFGPENLAYKMLRSQGIITKLYDLRDKLHSQRLSIEGMYSVEESDEKMYKHTPTVEQLVIKYKVPKRDILIQLEKGIKVELEHTSERNVARKIALDHIGEDPHYYNKLEKANLEEARRNPEQNRRSGSGKYDLINYAEDNIDDKDNWAVSMTMEPKLGINPRAAVSEDTPKGIYFYPLRYFMKMADRNESLPWGDNFPYLQLFQYDRSGEMTKQTKVDPAKLKQVLSQYCPEEVIQQASEEDEYDGTPYWFIYDCLSRLGQNDETNVVRWNKVLRDLGFTSVYDDGGGWIAYNEPTQGVVLDPRIIKQHKMFDNRNPTLQHRRYDIQGLADAIGWSSYFQRESQLQRIYNHPDEEKVRLAVAKSMLKPFLGKSSEEADEMGYDQAIKDAADKVIGILKQPINEASGYIPSEKQKNDPRFKTALTVDVHPDSIKKNAKAFGWLTSRAGIPPTAKTSGKIS